MENRKKETGVGRRDFIKATTFASMAAAIPAAGAAAADTPWRSTAIGSKSSPAGNTRNLLFASDSPDSYGKLTEKIQSVKEYDFRISTAKIDYQKPEEFETVLQNSNADVMLLTIPRVGLSSAKITDHINNLDIPVIIMPGNLDLIMLEADIVATLRKKGINTLLANSEAQALEMLKVVSAPRILEGKKALIFGRPFDSTSVPAHNLDADYIYRHTGVRLEYRPISDLKLLLDKVDEAKAREEMQRWKNEAVKIVEPTDESILRSSKMYVLLRALIDKEGLSAVSIDCLNFSFEPNPILPLPCLAYVRLRDEGISAPCEADVCMMLSSMLLQEISGKSFFHFNVSEVNNAESYTVLRHCVAPVRMMGADAPPLPYNLRDYHGMGRDVVPEVEFPVGSEVTMGGFSKDLKDFVLWPGRILPSVHDMERPSFPNMPDSKMRRYCSNRAQVKIRNVDRFLQSIAGIHNVFVAGSYTKEIYAALTRMNVNVIAPPDLTPPEV